METSSFHYFSTLRKSRRCKLNKSSLKGGDLNAVPYPHGDGDHGSPNHLCMNAALIGQAIKETGEVDQKESDLWKPLPSFLGGKSPQENLQNQQENSRTEKKHYQSYH